MGDFDHGLMLGASWMRDGCMGSYRMGKGDEIKAYSVFYLEGYKHEIEFKLNTNAE
jgi:hypothetical protein